jgi:hypothetical protein
VWVLVMMLPMWGMISGVDSQPIATTFTLTIYAPSIEPEFMLEYDAVFGDERAEDSTNDRPVPELSNWNNVLLQRALAEHAPEVPECWDLSQAHRVVDDGLRFDDSVPLINHAMSLHRRVLYLRSWR